MTARRLAFLVLLLALTAGFLALAWHVLAGGGWTVWEVLVLLCLFANAPWLALASATAITGFAIRMLARDPVALVLPLRPVPELAVRTVMLACVRLEAMDDVLPPLERLLRDLRAGPSGQLFSLAVLSDTPPGAAAAREEAAVARLAARFPAGAVLYRRRESNAGWKAGNIMSFLDGPGQGFDFALVLDADSAMSAAAVRRLAALMQSDPRTAILQPTVAGHGPDTLFARLFGLGHREGSRIWATGQAWWQGPQGPYWGHNALIRISAFRADARLPLLPGGGHILSHDHVEAALLHGAGWAVRVVPEDAGSAERHPPDLPAMFDRDIRWAAGNLQYRHLLRDPRLGRIGRLQLVQCILHYLLTPLWFAPLPLAAINAATGGGEGTPRGALVALVLAGFLMLHLPKLLGLIETALRGRDRPAPRDVAAELAMGVLLDPLSALDRMATLWRLATGGGAGWRPQARDGRGLAWRDGLRRFGWHTGIGLALLALFAAGGSFAVLLALPALAGLLLSVPLAVVTARPEAPAPAPLAQSAAERSASP